MDELAYALKVEGGSPDDRKLLKAVRAFETSITYHRARVANDGARYRRQKFPSGDKPSTNTEFAFAFGAVARMTRAPPGFCSSPTVVA